MKKLNILLFCCLFSSTALLSQEISLKYGKVTMDELKMETYQKDTTAAAVVLYENGNTYYDYTDGDGFNVCTDESKKIKILKKEGVKEADISIPYYHISAVNKETINKIEAIAYNLENGKIIKTKLDKKYIFDEEINNNYRQVKFSIPDVKIGTVIEFKYSRTSEKSSDLPNWEIQGNIPVLNSDYEVLIPEYFIYSIDTKGFEDVKVNEKPQVQTFTLNSVTNGKNNIIISNSRNIKFSAKDVPALKDENYVWYVRDFTAGVRFELKATKFPYDYYKAFSQTWEDLESTLKDKTDFGPNLQMGDIYKNEIKALVDTLKDENQKIEQVYSFIKNHIRWNESYAFFGNDAKDAAKKGIGNNAQINMILISALKDAGIKAFPILISRRSTGRLPYAFPSLNKLNTFIVAAETSDGKLTYMDGSAIYGGPNMLPTDLLVDRGYVYNTTHTEKWVDLTNIAKNQQISRLRVTLNKDGQLTGERNTIYTNQMAYSYKASFTASKDSAEFIENFQNSNKVTIDSLKIEDKDPMSEKVVERMDFTKKIDAAGDYLYINPLVFLHIAKNDFTQKERKLPVEFNYPYLYQSSCTLIIPENYKIEEIPKSIKVTLNDNQGECLYQIIQEGNIIVLKYVFTLNQTIFPQTEYPSLRDFYGSIVAKNAEMIVLKKI